MKKSSPGTQGYVPLLSSPSIVSFCPTDKEKECCDSYEVLNRKEREDRNTPFIQRSGSGDMGTRVCLKFGFFCLTHKRPLHS